jgi:hypothetical protein
MYNKIDSAKYAKYLPVREAEDVENMLSALKEDKRFRKWSEDIRMCSKTVKHFRNKRRKQG